MNSLPSGHEQRQVARLITLNGGQIPSCEAVILSEGHVPFENIQLKDRLVPTADDMNVRGPMIVRIHNHPESANPQYGWH